MSSRVEVGELVCTTRNCSLMEDPSVWSGGEQVWLGGEEHWCVALEVKRFSGRGTDPMVRVLCSLGVWWVFLHQLWDRGER
jgi:hypothetical protein